MTSKLVPEIIDISVTATGTAANLIPVNKGRKALFIQNVSAVNVGIAPAGKTAVIGAAGTTTLAPGDSFGGNGASCPTNGFSVVAESSAAVTVWEVI